MADYIATLINPTRHPVWGKRMYDVYTSGEYTSIYVPIPIDEMEDLHAGRSNNPHQVGIGYIDDNQQAEIDGETYLRSHSPGGVKEKKTGLGLILYTGICLMATMRRNAYGIFSPEGDRSGSADEWWKSQMNRGYAEEDLESHDGCENIYVPIDESSIDSYDLAEQAGVEYNDSFEITSVEEAYVEVCWQQERAIQFLRTEKVAASGLVLVWNEEQRFLDGHLSEDWKPPDPDILLGLKLDNVRDPKAILALMERLLNADVTPDRIGEFLIKSESPFGPNDMSMSMRQEFGFEVARDIEKAYRDRQKQLELVFHPNRLKREKKSWDEFYGSLVDSD